MRDRWETGGTIFRVDGMRNTARLQVRCDQWMRWEWESVWEAALVDSVHRVRAMCASLGVRECNTTHCWYQKLVIIIASCPIRVDMSASIAPFCCDQHGLMFEDAFGDSECLLPQVSPQACVHADHSGTTQCWRSCPYKGTSRDSVMDPAAPSVTLMS